MPFASAVSEYSRHLHPLKIHSSIFLCAAVDVVSTKPDCIVGNTKLSYSEDQLRGEAGGELNSNLEASYTEAYSMFGSA